MKFIIILIGFICFILRIKCIWNILYPPPPGYKEILFKKQSAYKEDLFKEKIFY